MCDLDLPANLRDKLYQITPDRTGNFSRIVSYFPLSEDEKQIIASFFVDTNSSIEFRSIFSDHISENDWRKSKDNIIKRFQEELFDID